MSALVYRALCLILCLGTALHLRASGIFVLDSKATYQAAIDGGLLSPVTSWDAGMEFLFPGDSADFVSATLATDSTGLLVQFVTNFATSIFGDDYTYGVDPDLTGKKIDKKIEIPPLPGATGAVVSIMLTDTNGKHKAWTIVGPPGGSVQPDFAADQGSQGADGFKQDPGFDITKVTIIRDGFSYTFPAPPPKQGGAMKEDLESVTPGTKLPEPSTSILVFPVVLFLVYHEARCRRRRRGPR